MVEEYFEICLSQIVQSRVGECFKMKKIPWFSRIFTQKFSNPWHSRLYLKLTSFSLGSLILRLETIGSKVAFQSSLNQHTRTHTHTHFLNYPTSQTLLPKISTVNYSIVQRALIRNFNCSLFLGGVLVSKISKLRCKYPHLRYVLILCFQKQNLKL